MQRGLCRKDRGYDWDRRSGYLKSGAGGVGVLEEDDRDWEVEWGAKVGEGASIGEIEGGWEAESKNDVEVINFLNFFLQKSNDRKNGEHDWRVLLHPWYLLF